MYNGKEYPATHSMATSWYIVDDDDNVGILQSDDNGPIPFGIRHEGCYANDLIFGELLDEKEMPGAIQFNDEQLQDLLEEPHRPHNKKHWNQVVVEIDTNKRDSCLDIIKNSNIDYEGCISEERGLYKIDPWQCTDSKEKVIKGSALDKLITSGVILKVYDIPELDMNCDYDNESDEVIFKKYFKEVPYYIYLQPYWCDYLQRRIHQPLHPVKLSQIESGKTTPILRVPGNFKDMEDLQIAAWYPSEVSSAGDYVTIEEQIYTLLPMPDGTKKYLLTSAGEFNFCNYCYCNRKRRRHQKQCAPTFSRTNIVEPTALFIIPPQYEDCDYYSNYNNNGLTKQLSKKLFITSYIGNILKDKESDGWESAKEVAKKLSKTDLLFQLQNSQGWIENIVNTLKPRVIIISKEALDIFSQVFAISDNLVDISGEHYPIYNDEDFEMNKDNILRLANLPYQGKKIRTSYSKEEMEEIKRSKRAK